MQSGENPAVLVVCGCEAMLIHTVPCAQKHSLFFLHVTQVPSSSFRRTVCVRNSTNLALSQNNYM